MVYPEYFRNVPLPEDLTIRDLQIAMEKTEDFFSSIRDKTNINLSGIIQSNNFSGVVSNVFTNMLGEVSVYKPYSDQRYPDLLHQYKNIGLEVKASNKPMKGGEGHNGHSGWHIIVCFELLPNGDIEFSQVEIAELIGFEYENSDWKYLGSKRNENESQRTETYTTNRVGTAKLRDGTVYLNPNYVEFTSRMMRERGKIDEWPIPDFSPFNYEL